MKREDFTDAVLEQFFVQGLNCQSLPLLWMYANMEGVQPDEACFTCSVSPASAM